MPVSTEGVVTELFILKVYSFKNNHTKLYQIPVNGQVFHLRKRLGRRHNKWILPIAKKKTFPILNWSDCEKQNLLRANRMRVDDPVK